MNNSSDNKLPQYRINDLLSSDVFDSNFTKSLYSTTFDRMLSRSDVERVTGYIGTKTTNSTTVDRQLSEDTAYRQLNQLQPIVTTTEGEQTKLLSYERFVDMLGLMGVDKDRLDDWGFTTTFNWAPPINLDKLINYQDYYWVGASGERPQYVVIEDRCASAQMKLDAYDRMLSGFDSAFQVLDVDIRENTMLMNGAMTQVFVPGFQFFTVSDLAPFNERFWTVVDSTFIPDEGTTIIIVEPLAVKADTPPNNPTTNTLWLNTITDVLFLWDGMEWKYVSPDYNVVISLQEMRSVFQMQVNCSCHGDQGWDINQWDDNQKNTLLWNTEILKEISWPTEESWAEANPNRDQDSVWFDTTNNLLKAWSVQREVWVILNRDFNSVIASTEGKSLFDLAIGCEYIEGNDWTRNNKWKHKTQLDTFSIATRAQIPIIEYSASVDFNSWLAIERQWKYRKSAAHTFENVDVQPTRIELEPIKGYVAEVFKGDWVLYLLDPKVTGSLPINYTDTFVPGYKFKIENDLGDTSEYVTKYSQYRNLDFTLDNEGIISQLGTEVLVTVVVLQEADFTSSLTVSEYNDRIIPSYTSLGDTWMGYQINWMLDVDSIKFVPSEKPMVNHELSDVTSPTIRQLTGIGTLTVYKSAQELSVYTSQTEVEIDPNLRFNPNNQSAYATDTTISVYVNGQHLSTNEYQLERETADVTYTAVGNSLLPGYKLEYVTKVILNEPAVDGDVIRIEVGASAFNDLGLTSVPVRTIEDETLFAASVIEQKQPIYMSLNRYTKYAQDKMEDNQYPLFNVYDILTNEVIDAKPVFMYDEHHKMEIDLNVNKRIVKTPDYGDFNFKQTLIDEHTNEIFAYRDIRSVAPRTYWFSPNTNQLKFWFEDTWNDVIIDVEGKVTTHTRPIVSVIEPTPPVRGSYWYNPATNELFKRLINRWAKQNAPIVNITDPSLFSIWRTGTTPTQYEPSKIEGTNEWNMLDSWFYNPSHENRHTIKYTELMPHFTDIMSQQQRVAGLPNGGGFTLTQNQLNLGAGGTIKEFNYNLDNLISAVNVDYVNPIQILEFAQTQYQLLLDRVKAACLDLLPDLIVSNSTSVLEDGISKAIYDIVRGDNFTTGLYYDTTSYNENTQVGVPNWIATLPIMGITRAQTPILLHYKNQYEIKHHDGHVTNVVISTADRIDIVKRITQRLNPNGAHIGIIKRQDPILTEPEFLDHYRSTNMFLGAVWYNSRTGILYKFEPISISERAPSTNYPTDSVYYNNVTKTTYILKLGHWLPLAPEGSRSIVGCWKEISLVDILCKGILSIERRLFERAEELWKNKNVADLTLYNDIVESDSAVREQHLFDRFNQFYGDKGRINPFLNQQYTPTDAFTWNYAKSIITEYPSFKTVDRVPAYWKELYQDIFGTAQPHIEPWILQGFTNKPDWWDDEYLNLDTSAYKGRRWKSTYNLALSEGEGMWENIRVGFIPHGRLMPSGIISTDGSDRVPYTYQYFCINISDETLNGTYEPDDILPPYFNVSELPHNTHCRSIFTDYTNQIVGPDSDYTANSGSPFNWRWKQSIDYQYDKLIAQFLTQPMKTMFNIMGRQYTTVGGLLVDTETKAVASHKRTIFHGNIHNGEVYRNNGLIQWYINFNRFGNFDTGQKFSQRWSEWNSKLSYMTASTNDTTQTQIYHKLFDITERDYDFTFANTSLLDSSKLETFKMKVINFPPQINAYNNDNEWVVELGLNRDVVDDIEYYDADVFPFVVEGNVGKLNQYVIKSITRFSNVIVVEGNVERMFDMGDELELFNSPMNDGTYTVNTSTYDHNTDTTRIAVVEDIPGSIGLGYVRDPKFVSPFEPGDLIHISATKLQPGKIQSDAAYYFRYVDDNSFEVSESYNGALEGTNLMDLVQPTRGHLTVGRIDTSFRVYGGAVGGDKRWYHYKLNNRKLKKTLPTTFRSIQSVINFIDGYAKLVNRDSNISLDGDIITFDEFTGRANGWQLEIENLIIYALLVRSRSTKPEEKYSIYVSPMNPSLFHYRAKWPTFTDGTQVNIVGTNGVPYPLDSRVPYYYKEVEGGFNLYTTSLMESSNMIEIGDHSYNGSLFIQRFNDAKTDFIATEINPNRQYVKISTPKGVTSNIFIGPSVATATDMLIFDQFGERLNTNDVMTYRQDDHTIIEYTNQDRSERHIAGINVFVEGYEHVIQFNNYTVGGVLLYDPFLGIRTQRLEVDFYRESEPKLRPTLGGYYLTNGELKRNFEGHADDLRDVYDWYKQRSFSTLSKYAYNLVGYRPSNALNMIDVGDKSQILFYQGMIKQKGTNNALEAFVNSRFYNNVEVDEFWAVKLGNFGSVKKKQFVDIELTSDDNHSSTIKIVSLDNKLNETQDNVGFKTDDSVVLSFGTHTDRWIDYPIVRQTLDNPVLMHSKQDFQIFEPEDVLEVNGQFYLNIEPRDHVEAIISFQPVNIEIVNTHYIKFLTKPDSDITIIGYKLDTSRHNPIKVIDTIDMNTPNTIPAWHPAFGEYDYLVKSNVDLIQADDPAEYDNGTNSNYWSWAEVGKRWINTRTLGYKPYYDQFIFKDEGDRFKLWGKQADWSAAYVYQWVESAVPPDEYVGPGLPRQVLRFKKRTTMTVTGNGTTELHTIPEDWIETYKIVEGTRIVLVGNTQIPETFVVNSVTPFSLNLLNSDEVLTFEDQVEYNMVVSFDNIDWTTEVNPNVEFVGEMVVDNKWVLSTDFSSERTVSVFINGAYVGAEEILDNMEVNLAPYTLNPADIIQLRQTPYIPTSEELDYVNEGIDDGRSTIWSYVTDYVSAISVDQELRFYFWVGGIEQHSVGNRISISEVARRFDWVGYPFFTVDYPKMTNLRDVRYRRLMIHNARNLIRADNRYILRIRDDNTQRDDVDLNKPAQHEEWQLIRRGQETKVSKDLWDKLVESMIGKSLKTGTSLPSLELTLWDQDHDAYTRYGLGANQVIADKEVLKSTVLGYLMSPNVDLYPIDIESFLSSADFDSIDGIVEAMEAIYDNFSTVAVNQMWFECLEDGLVACPKYEGLMKTSWVALTGEQKLNVNGQMED